MIAERCLVLRVYLGFTCCECNILLIIPQKNPSTFFRKLFKMGLVAIWCSLAPSINYRGCSGLAWI